MPHLDNDTGVVKFRYLARILREMIESGKYRPGELIPTETELQEQYHTSRATVRSAIELLVRDQYLRKERGRGKGTVVISAYARRQRVRKGYSLGMVVYSPNLDSNASCLQQVIAGIIDRANRIDSSFTLFPFAVEPQDQFELVRSVLDRNAIDGLFLLDMLSFTEPIIDHLNRRRFPFVFLLPHHAFTPRLPARKIPQVHMDELTAFAAMLAEARATGVREIVVVGTATFPVAAAEALVGAAASNDAIPVRRMILPASAECLPQLATLLDSRDPAPRRLALFTQGPAIHYFDAVAAPDQRKGLLVVVDVRHAAGLPAGLENRYGCLLRPHREFGQAAGEIMCQLLANRTIGTLPQKQQITLTATYQPPPTPTALRLCGAR